jgi:hypothetical protein
MSCQHFHHARDGLLSALGVHSVEIPALPGQAFQQAYHPLPIDAEGFQGEHRIVLRIVGELCPRVLVGALDGRAAGFEDDANAKSVYKLGVGQVSQDLRDRPLVRGGALRQFLPRDTLDQPGNLPRSGGQDFHRLLSLEEAEDPLGVLLRRFMHDRPPSF